MTKQPNGPTQYDVFLSHQSGDKQLVEILATQLEDKEGLKPFLDKWHLIPGDPWQEALEEALSCSKTCAVFLGPNGIGPWENEEMRSALDEHVRNNTFRVIPVLLPGANLKDPATLPRFLRRLTWVDFRSGLDDPEAFRRLVAGIRGKAPGRGLMPKVSDLRLTRKFSILLLILPSLLVIFAILGLINWRIPTRIRVDLSVSRVAFTLDGTDSKPILNSVRFRSLAIENFAQLEASPDKLEVANPAAYQLAEDEYPESAWSPIEINSKMIMTGQDKTLQPAVTLENSNKVTDTTGVLDQIWARPGSEISFEVIDNKASSITVKVDNQESSAVVSIHHPLQLITKYCSLSSASESPFQADSLTYRLWLSNHSPEIDIKGQPDSIVYTFSVSPENGKDLFNRIGIPVTSLDFTSQDKTGNRITSLVGDGEISYPDYPEIKRVSFKSPDYIRLDRLEKFNIETITLDSEHEGIRLRLHGITGHLGTGSHEFQRDHRLTCFDSLRQNPRLMALVSILVWMVPTAVGGYKMYRELKGGNS
jgi:hypothetical protein